MDINNIGESVIGQVVAAGILSGSTVLFGRWLFFKRERILARNLKRKIVVFSTPGKDMSHSRNVLRKVGLFKVEELMNEPKELDNYSANIIVVIGYSESNKFKETYKKASELRVPIIVYAEPGNIKNDFSFIQEYTHHVICNTPLRLVSDVYSITATFTEEIK